MAKASSVYVHGKFTRYYPAPGERPPGYEAMPEGAKYGVNERGEDFYATVYRPREGASGRRFMLVSDAGVVVQDELDDWRETHPGRYDLQIPVDTGETVLEVAGLPDQSYTGWTRVGQHGFEYLPPPVTDVSAAQALVILERVPTSAGKSLGQLVEEWVSASGDRELKAWYTRATRWQITNPNIAKAAAQFGLSPQQVQYLFNEASKIEE